MPMYVTPTSTHRRTYTYMSGGFIASALFQAAATAALRPQEKRKVTMADLKKAIEVGKTKNKGDIGEMYRNLYV